MGLTGKAKEDFEKWFISQFRNIENDQWAILELNNFYRHHESMKWGVYVDFFDNMGFYVETDVYDWVDPVAYGAFVNNKPAGKLEYDSLQEARKVAIEKASEIYNQLNQE